MIANGTTITYRRRQYEVTGYVPSRPQYPYTVKRLPDGKLFKMPADIVEGTPAASPVIPTTGIPAVGSTFICKGTEYRVTGYTPSRPKFPVSATRTRDGAPFKFTLAACGAVTAPTTGVATPTATKPTIRIGDWVEFSINHPRKPPVIAGFVTKINSIICTLSQTTDGHPVGWRMPMSSLRPSTMPKPAPAK